MKMSCGPCFGAVDVAHGKTIAWYTVAMGSDPAFSRSKANIMSFMNVGLNTSVTFDMNPPLSAGVKFYFTVRAYNMPGVYAEATSNGITGGGLLGLQPANVTVPSYIKSLLNLSVSWTPFNDPVPIYYYEIAIFLVNGYNNVSTHSVISYMNVGLSTNHFYSNLTNILFHNHTYMVCVRATDISLIQNVSCSNIMMVDLTPPCAGIVIHENTMYSPRMTISYEPVDTHLMVTWAGFEDEESGISSYSVAVVSDSSCDVPVALGLASSSSIPLECALYSLNGSLLNTLLWKIVGDGSITNFTYILPQGETLLATLRYAVLVKATNQAGASVIAASPSIMLDNTLPQTGAVKNGGDFRSDVAYQHESNRMTATWTQAYTSDQLLRPTTGCY